MSSEALTQSPMDGGADDLPRTLRREREARYREALERSQREKGEPVSAREAAIASRQAGFEAEPRLMVPEPMRLSDEPRPAIVTALQIPFLHLMLFFMKAVAAAIPALILLGIILWSAGALLQGLFPSLVKMRILIDFPR